MEENLWSKKPFITDINLKWLFGDRIDPIVFLDVLIGVHVELVELFGDIWTDIAVSFLDGLGRFQ